LICEEQKGFLPGRYIGENIRLIYDIIEETNKQDTPGLLLIVDFEKAFDYISREFIVECLELLGFGSTFIRWIRAQNAKATALFHQNGYLLRSVRVERECRQGDPISPYLFVTSVQILNHLIQGNKNIKGISVNGTEHKSIHYADDTEFLLDGSEGSLRATLDTLSNFHNISGLNINKDKTRAIWQGSKAGSQEQMCLDHNLSWKQDPFKI